MNDETQPLLLYAASVVDTVRQPLLVLNADLRVRKANSSFYRTFKVEPGETVGQLVYDLGNQQWNIPSLRKLLEEVLPGNTAYEDLEVDHIFPALGRKFMLLNARRVCRADNTTEFILLAIEDRTDHKRDESALRESEIRYRRLFQTAQDGILILDAGTGRIIDANPFMTALLGYSHDDFAGKELWEIGLFRDIEESRTAYRELQEKGYIRYEHLPLQSRSGVTVDVEFVSNIYLENDKPVIQCNIRDITERCHLERQTKEQAAALADRDRRKDEFLALLSHELRNPLAPILMGAQTLNLPVFRGLPR